MQNKELLTRYSSYRIQIYILNTKKQQNSVFSSIMSEEKQWISGGSFGLEGGAAVSIVLMIGILCFLLMTEKDESGKVKSETVNIDFQEETFVLPED